MSLPCLCRLPFSLSLWLFLSLFTLSLSLSLPLFSLFVMLCFSFLVVSSCVCSLFSLILSDFLPPPPTHQLIKASFPFKPGKAEKVPLFPEAVSPSNLPGNQPQTGLALRNLPKAFAPLRMEDYAGKQVLCLLCPFQSSQGVDLCYQWCVCLVWLHLAGFGRGMDTQKLPGPAQGCRGG